MSIETENLLLLPYSPEQLLALIDGVEQFEQIIGLTAAKGLGDFMRSDDVSPAWLARLRESQAPDPWVHGFAVVHGESRLVIGSAGFKGPPDDTGEVEIAYGIVPDYEGRGYATEAASALVSFAFESGHVKRVRAHTLPATNASTRVLTKCGFKYTGEVVDPEDGLVWRWERERPAD
jgi:ribosomal-protein-alanine N-acetyltransferase